MKLQLSVDELTDIVRKSMNIPSEEVFTLEIIGVDSSLISLLQDAIKEFPNYMSNQKIQCIKKFRDSVPQVEAEGRMVPSIGLADCKWAVENVDLAIANLRRNGKIHGL